MGEKQEQKKKMNAILTRLKTEFSECRIRTKKSRQNLSTHQFIFHNTQ